MRERPKTRMDNRTVLFQNLDDHSNEEVGDHIHRILTDDLPVQLIPNPVQANGGNNISVGLEQNDNSVGQLIQNIPVQPDGSDSGPEHGSLQFQNRKLSVALIYEESEWRRFGSIPGNLKLIHEKLMKLTQKMRDEKSEHYQVTPSLTKFLYGASDFRLKFLGF